MDKKYILIYGNPVDGLKFEGPFDTFDDAEEEASWHNDTWWIVDLIEPQHKDFKPEPNAILDDNNNLIGWRDEQPNAK
jgi:hypothetical protein